ncbi:transketolase family protein [Mycoplasmoides pirum]|uniref:transketolase-like TK C-terminal-containing protein n=1 Tax=Mycoplasmoides pirum TaxID=2122 RepID=UPI0004881D6F|nr:transketolase [Mycoplasmoides pirum]
MQKNNLTIDTIRLLGIEMIAKAKSGHPGIVLGAAPIMYTLFKNHLNVDLKNLNYFNRDRFILSAGHGSALLYATMYLSNYSSITLEDIKNFRQLNSKTSGHPESHILDGVDIGTGPLGQGTAASVGFAIAEAYLNKTYKGVVDHYTYCLLGDGCLQEGITHEAIAIAGRLKLNKLIWIYDSNDIQLDGKVKDSTITNFAAEFKANDWNYILVKNGNNVIEIDDAIKLAKKSDKPTLIEVKTIIGYGSINANSTKAHGTPLSWEQVEQVRSTLQFPYQKPFEINKKAKQDFNELALRGAKHHNEYKKRLNNLKTKNQKLYKQFLDSINLNFDFENIDLSKIELLNKDATRNVFYKVFNEFTKKIPNLLVINNDLSGSTKVKDNNSQVFDINSYDQKNINIGVREFLGAALAFGITMHKGVWGITSTFMSFADYAKPAIRLAAINQINSINVFSHDSITVGEDGPTHQPIEQLTMLRSIPNTITFRPANADEIKAAIIYALNAKTTPINIITSRSEFNQSKLKNYKSFKQGYYFVKKESKPNVNLIATGSEVGLCIDLAKELKKYKINASIISVTSMELLRQNFNLFKKDVLNSKVKSIAIELGCTYMWYEFVDIVYGINEFGKSGNPNDVMKYFKMDLSSLVKRVIKDIK